MRYLLAVYLAVLIVGTLAAALCDGFTTWDGSAHGSHGPPKLCDTRFLNIGTGKEISIGEFARLVAEIVGYRGKLVFDPSRPDGPPRKLLDVSKITALGWTAKTPMREGLQATYEDFLVQGATMRERCTWTTSKPALLT